MSIKMYLEDVVVLEGSAEELVWMAKELEGVNKEVEEEGSIQVGDYVRIKEEYKDKYNITGENMLLGKVESATTDGYEEDTVSVVYHKEHGIDSEIHANHSFSVNLEYFEKVDEPSPRDISYMKSGREVGELRKGDIVKLEGLFIDRFHKVYDVYKDTADVGSFYEDISQMSLVTPVDERLDLSDDDK